MAIVIQNPHHRTLPDFRNFGVLLRIVLFVCAAALAAAFVRAPDWRAMTSEFMALSAFAQPVLMLVMIVLYGASRFLRRLPYALGAGAVVGVALAATLVVYALGSNIYLVQGATPLRALLASAAASGVLLAYFDLRGRALSPALTEARLQALQARIRPHFLFNSINAVLSLIRADPRRAEVALEDMADLFRVLMADNRQLSPLSSEVALCRQYLNLEQLRLGERLRVEWHVDGMPADAQVPPLVLQPLLENAVYHGIEPRIDPGTVRIDIARRGEEVHATLRNPYQPEGSHHAGNRMAVANIRERLQLHFDAAARLTTRVEEGDYVVHIVMPYVRESDQP